MTVAIGFFDGVHEGHQNILTGADVALTFENHPLTILNPSKAPRLIMSNDLRFEAIRDCGIKKVISLPFTQELASKEPEQFLKDLSSIVGSDSSIKLRAGENWNFGRKGKGDAAFARSLGYSVETIPFSKCLGERISSTRIRKALSKGDILAACVMMGRPYYLTGEVIKGKGLGKEIGYPTVNVKLNLLPPIPFGVYVAEVGGCLGIANYGYAPTAGEKAWVDPIFEINFLHSMPADLERFKICLLKFIRFEKKFDSFEELSKQIEEDIRSIPL